MRHLRRFLREDAIEAVCIVGAFLLVGGLAERMTSRPDPDAIGFLSGLFAALAGLAVGKWLQSRYNRLRVGVGGND